MYIITTQCFASRIGGIESLVTNLALSFGSLYETLVFADQHLYVQDEVFDSENNKFLKIIRYGGVKFFRRYRKANAIKLLIQNNNIDGIIADTWKSLELCIDEINKKNIPVICLAHGNELIYENERRKKRILYTLNKIKNIVANSKYTAGLVKKLGIKDDCIHVVNPGAEDLSSKEITSNYNFSGKPILLTLARLEKRKGHKKVLLSLKKLKEDFPEIKYIVAGEGPEKKYLTKLTKMLNLEDHVYFIGNISNQEKKEIFEKVSLMVMPTSDETSERSIEGFGISYIEAAMFGICSIATDVGGVSEAIINNETGILLNANEDLYKPIKDLLLNEKKLKTLGIQAKQRAINKFNWRKVVEDYINIF